MPQATLDLDIVEAIKKARFIGIPINFVAETLGVSVSSVTNYSDNSPKASSDNIYRAAFVAFVRLSADDTQGKNPHLARVLKNYLQYENFIQFVDDIPMVAHSLQCAQIADEATVPYFKLVWDVFGLQYTATAEEFVTGAYQRVSHSSLVTHYLKSRENYSPSSLKEWKRDFALWFGDDLQYHSAPLATPALCELIKLKVRVSLSHLTERERQALSLYYGLESGQALTYERLGQMLVSETSPQGVTTERARQIVLKALRQLKHPRNADRLRMFTHRRMTDDEIEKELDDYPLTEDHLTTQPLSVLTLSEETRERLENYGIENVWQLVCNTDLPGNFDVRHQENITESIRRYDPSGRLMLNYTPLQNAAATSETLLSNALYEKVTEWPLSVRTVNCLKNEGIIFAADLVIRTRSDMLRVPNFGYKCLNEIEWQLSLRDLHLGMDIPKETLQHLNELSRRR